MSLYELKQIKHGYRGKTVLSVDELVIAEGTMTALVGPNGAGKSTLLRLLALLEKPVEGIIRVAGRVVTPKTRSLRHRIGWVMQQPYLFKGTALDNVMLGLKLRKIKERRARSLAMLSELGFDADPDSPVEALSGGQRQLMALARCLVLDPEILLLDEPFNHLDKQTAKHLQTMLQNLVEDQGVTVVFSSHDVAYSLVMAHETVALADGGLASFQPVNVFAGHCVGERFLTGQIEITLPLAADGSYVVVDPRDIILSLQPLHSSMRNRFKGKVVGMDRVSEGIRVEVSAGERFESLVTLASAREMGLTLGQPVWVNFKSTALKVF